MTTSLPIATQFCSVEVEVLPDVTLFLDGNSKITAGNGTYAAPKPNAFSLPAASVSGKPYCPGSTAVCRKSCYVHGLAKHDPGLYAKYKANAQALQTILDRPLSAFYESARALGKWISAHASAGFRWHVSGDVHDAYHAAWIVEVCEAAQYTPFWIYTRTLDVVPALIRAQNLAVNISADAENYDRALGMRARYPESVRIAYLQAYEGTPPYLPAGSIIFPDYPIRRSDPQWSAWTQAQRAMVCPTDFFGQSEAHRCGPCRKCL
jgi:hypothetical protein